LSVVPALLFRSLHGVHTRTPLGWWWATAVGCIGVGMLVLRFLPDPRFALGFISAVAALLGLLELVVRGIRRLALRLDQQPGLQQRFALRLALANLHRPGSALRTSLLSLGSALTLLVVCTITVNALIRTVAGTIPDQAPGLVLYDIAGHQRDAVLAVLKQHGAERIDVAPLVQARLARVNGERLAESPDAVKRREARDEHKLTYAANNIDDVTLARGRWLLDQSAAGARVVMEDREADQLGLEPGDQLTFLIEDRELHAELTGVFRQGGLQTRFWFEAILSDGALDPFITRYVGAAYLTERGAIDAQTDIAAQAPNVVTVRTAEMLATARELLGRGVAGLAAVAAVALGVSLLVLTSVVATSRARQVYEATILHAMGARLASIRRSLVLEYLLLATVTSAFAIVLGTVIAVPLLVYELKLPPTFPIWPAAVAAICTSVTCLHVGARYLLRRLRLQPALLLRSGE
jgi:putative ABC transport system permease protein